MSRRMGKPTFCIGENKGADQLRSNCEADQRLCFCYMDNTIPLNFQPLTIFCDCTARFVSDLVGTQIVGFLTHRLILFSLSTEKQVLMKLTSKKPSIKTVILSEGTPGTCRIVFNILLDKKKTCALLQTQKILKGKGEIEKSYM